MKKKGRSTKNYVVSEQNKIAELKYILARKEAKVKALKMENILMRDFLLLTPNNIINFGHHAFGCAV